MTRALSRRAFLRITSGAIVLGGVTAGCGDSASFVFTGGQANPPGPPGPALARLLEDQLLEFGSDGTAYRLDFVSHTVARLAADGSVVWEVGGLGDGTGLFNFPVALATDAEGLIYVADRGNGEIDVLDQNGALLRTFGNPQLSVARDMAIDSARGLVYVADGPAHEVKVFNLEGVLQRTLGQFGVELLSDLNFPSGVAVGPDGEVHVVDSGNGDVHVYSATGEFLRGYGSVGDELGQFLFPRAVVVDASGQSWVADGVAGFVTRFDSSGTPLDRFVPSFPDGTPGQPTYLALSPSGELIVTAVRNLAGLT